MTKKGELQSRQQIEALFTQRRQVATDTAKELSALGRTEAASVTHIECPECLAVRDIQPKGESVKFPWHPKRITRTPNHGIRPRDTQRETSKRSEK